MVEVLKKMLPRAVEIDLLQCKQVCSNVLAVTMPIKDHKSISVNGNLTPRLGGSVNFWEV
jgi:hypothetical protein